MPTVTEILDLAPGAGYLAANDKGKSVLFNNFGRLNPVLPQQIYALYFILKKIYDKDPDYSGLIACCNYLWEIMGRYGIQAQSLTGGGGSVPTPTPDQPLFPIYITQVDFSTATLYPNTSLFGNNVIVYYNEIQRYLIPNVEFTVTTSGLEITLAGFDAETSEVNMVIEKIYNG